MGPGDQLVGVDWSAVTHQLVAQGWARLTSAIDPATAAELEAAAPGPWMSLPESEGDAGVRQAGIACHSDVDGAHNTVRSLAAEIRAGIDATEGKNVPPVPAFNHVQWCRTERGQKYITPHRDPDSAAGLIAVVTIRGQALFRVWDIDINLNDAQQHHELASQWETCDGDLVLLRGGGWPNPTSKCPIHEAQSPPAGQRVTLTLRHNRDGYGSDYFT